MLSKIVKI